MADHRTANSGIAQTVVPTMHHRGWQANGQSCCTFNNANARLGQEIVENHRGSKAAVNVNAYYAMRVAFTAVFERDLENVQPLLSSFV